MPPRQWKHRLNDMKEAITKVLQFCEGIRDQDEFASNLKTFDACIRNFQILGEASAKIPSEVQKELPRVPWREIKQLRNLLVHEYFGVSSSILWSTIGNDLPKLLPVVEAAVVQYSRPIHRWRICSPGEIYIRPTVVDQHRRRGALVREHLRRDHCREMSNSAKDILSLQEVQDIREMFFNDLVGPPAENDLGFGKAGIAYDRDIRGWTQYWNDIFLPEPRLDPDLVKALIASESSFDERAGKKRRNSAKGLMQLMPATIRYLNGERQELRDNIFSLQGDEIYEASANISAGIRWLFRKRETASSRLGRTASWEEAVEEYKDYLRRRLRKPKLELKGMNIFRDYLARLKAKN